MAQLNGTCIICRDGDSDEVKSIKIQDPGKLSSSSLSNHGKTILRWKHLIAESFCMLFGLPVNHSLLYDDGDEEEPHFCTQCFQDLNDIHFIFWQLHNLEVKLIKLQNVIFQRLNFSLETQERSSGNSSSFNDLTENLLKDIKSGSHNLPTGVYISRWKDAMETVNQKIPNISLSSPNQPNKIEIKVDPDFLNESSPSPVYQVPLEDPMDSDYFLDEDDEYILDPNDETGNDTISEDDYEEDDNNDDDDEDYKEEVKNPRKRKTGRPLNTIKNSYNFTQDSDGNYVCTVDPAFCSRIFPTRKQLSKHFSDFHKGRDFACDQEGCVQKFKSEITLFNHKKNFHKLNIKTTVKPRKRLLDPSEGKPGLLCTEDPSICNRMYERLKDLNKHIVEFHKGRDYACDLDNCVEKFRSELRLSQHRKRVHGFGLEIKPEKSRKRGKYKKRENSKLEKSESSVCEVCGLTIPQKRMKKHFKASHLGYGRFKCDLCGMDFTNSEEVKFHEDLHSQFVSTFPFTCVGGGDCQQIFTNTVDLRTHVKMSHLSSNLKCETCGIMKANKFLMQRHLRESHDPKKERNQVCEECGKAYFTGQALKEHVRSAHSKEQIYCEICNKGFYRKSALSHHKMSHQSVKPYSCSICGKGFHNMQHLKKHEDIHSGIKKYECKECGKSFKQYQNLSQHLRTQVHRPKKYINRGEEGESVKFEENLA